MVQEASALVVSQAETVVNGRSKIYKSRIDMMGKKGRSVRASKAAFKANKALKRLQSYYNIVDK